MYKLIVTHIDAEGNESEPAGVCIDDNSEQYAEMSNDYWIAATHIIRDAFAEREGE